MAQLEVNAYRRRRRMVTETVEVESRGDGTHVLLSSPYYAMGVAAGDVITVQSDGWATCVEHGGNVCVQVFHRLDLAPMEQLRARVADLGGHGNEPDVGEVASFAVPVAAGFQRIESPFVRIERLYGNRMTWRFGNVYEDDGVTPLDWWED